MSGSDQYSLTTVSQGSWSASVTYTPANSEGPGSVTVLSLGSGSVLLTGVIASPGDEVQSTFEPPSISAFNLRLSAVCDIAGGALFTDGASLYLFSSGTLSVGVAYPTVTGFGAYSEALAPPVCLVSGTRIQTGRGMVDVAALRLSDLVVTGNGESRPIRWIGRQTIRCSSFAPPCVAWPISIDRGAFGRGRPSRPVLLSPNHAVMVNDTLVPIRLLVNEASIRQVPTEQVDYYHVELPQHDVILAEGLLVETYLDQGHRHHFRSLNAAGRWAQPKRGGLNGIPGRPYRPYANSATGLQAVRDELLNRAVALGFARSKDPDFQLATTHGSLHTTWDGVVASAEIPAGVSKVRLQSDVAVPSRQCLTQDHRVLGAAIAHMQLGTSAIALDDSGLCRGWYPIEGAFRWTNGSATLRFKRSRFRRRLVITTVPMLEYWKYNQRE